MMNEKPLILVINDDGITAPGIQALISYVKDLGELIVVAPDKAQSGMGHAITINSTLRLTKYENNFGVTAYSCSGTPVDCVKFGTKVVAAGRTVDLVISGINHGTNSSINVIYSGTMSAAVEGAVEQIPSIGFSLDNHALDADFSACRNVVRSIITEALNKLGADGYALNVNIPNVPEEELKGIKVCRQAKAYWNETFEERKDPYGGSYYWLAGEFIYKDEGEDTDIWALKNNYVSVVPTKFDLTEYDAIHELKQWDEFN
ncbi:MAG: 5'/3'-nucleotidase SurE [Flavobacteriales bacterium]|nr:5'/3'-nucleotidase SurE [Flavobacteriales bacterium]|tara:strand:+ start:2675 stop:3454 length:780 start_codon:yes stop_codon:yes gene_type:complete